MVKKYTDNYRLDIAYATIFRNLNAIEEIPIHTALKITSGDNLTKNDMIPGDYIVYGGGGETGSTHAKFNIDYKTIGIGRVGARCGCVFEIVPNSWVTDNALMIQSYDKRFSLDFLRHFLSYSDIGQYANNAMQPVISKTRIKDVAIPLIDIQEQNALSKILDSIEKNEKFESNDYDLLKSKIKIIDNLETLNVEIKIQNDLTAQLKQSILQEAIQGKLTADWRKQNPNTESANELLKRIKAEKDQLIEAKKIKKEKALPPITEEEIPFELPDGWVWCRIPQILALTKDPLRRGPFGSSLKKDMFEPKRIDTTKVYEQQNAIKKQYNLGEYYISTKKYPNLNSFLAGPGDILISCAGTIGETYKLPLEAPIGIINQALLKIRLNNTAILDNFFLMMFKSQLKGQVNSDAKGSAMKNMGSVKYLKNELVFGLPPLEEQNVIVKKVETLMNKCQDLEQEIKTSEVNAQMLMQAVLKEAFEGKKEVVEV